MEDGFGAGTKRGVKTEVYNLFFFRKNEFFEVESLDIGLKREEAMGRS